jgi:ribosomal protein S14
VPISIQYKSLYHADWPEISAAIRFDRANGRCEHCARPHGKMIAHLGDGRWLDTNTGTWRDGQGRPLRRLVRAEGTLLLVKLTKVVLATAHLDHDPRNSDPENLKSLCQRCHMIHDHPEHMRRAWLTRHMRKALGDLFLGPYSQL